MKYERRIRTFLQRLWLSAFAVLFGLWLGLCVWAAGFAAGVAAAVAWPAARIPNIWRYGPVGQAGHNFKRRKHRPPEPWTPEVKP